MEKLRRFRNLRGDQRSLLVQTFAVLIAVRLGLWFLPFARLLKLVGAVRPGTAASAADETSVDTVVWAVTTAARAVPAATCLTQALAGQALLRRRGIDTTLRLGVARGHGGRLRAHAWLERGNSVVLGGSGIEEFTPLPAVDVHMP